MANPRLRLGNWGERVARNFLVEKGYSVLEIGFRSAWGEVDIVAGDGEELVFVEVRTRRGAALGTPEESVTRTKARRLIAAAQSYMEERDVASADWRIDLISIVLDSRGRVQELSHLTHAVEAEGW